MSKPESKAGDGGSIDHLWLNKVYPSASDIFEFSQRPLEELIPECFVVLDANVLLLPFRLGAHSLLEIKKVFSKLAGEDRVFIPGQAVREFLKHRASKIRDIIRDLNSQASQIQILSDRKIGFLDGDADYAKLISLSETIKAAKKETLATIEAISARLKAGVGSDPVSKVYQEIFKGRVVELELSPQGESALKEEMDWRYSNSIPPGYKDRTKPDEGIGDLIIWKTVLDLAARLKKDCIFVTEDAKGDWWVQSEGAFQPRVELVEEFRRASEGKTIHLAPLSTFLGLAGAETAVVDEAKEVEAERRRRQKIVEDHIKQLEINQQLGLSTPAVIEGDDSPDSQFDRTRLLRQSAQLQQKSMALTRELSALNRILHDAEQLDSKSEAEIAEIFARRANLERQRSENFSERREIDKVLKRHFLG